MPTIVLRGLDPALTDAVKREAARQNLTVREMTIRLLQAGLRLAAKDGRAGCGRWCCGIRRRGCCCWRPWPGW